MDPPPPMESLGLAGALILLLQNPDCSNSEPSPSQTCTPYSFQLERSLQGGDPASLLSQLSIILPLSLTGGVTIRTPRHLFHYDIRALLRGISTAFITGETLETGGECHQEGGHQDGGQHGQHGGLGGGGEGGVLVVRVLQSVSHVLCPC